MTRFKNASERRYRSDTSAGFKWAYSVRLAVGISLLLSASWSAFGQSEQPGHLPTKKQAAPMSPAEQKNLAIVLNWWREVVESRHTELAMNYAAEDFIQHNPNIPTGRAALLKFFEGMGPAITPIPDHLVDPPVVEGAKEDFVWLVFEHEGKNPKDPSKPIYGYSFDLLRIENGKIQEHWDSDRKHPGSPPFVPSKAPAPSSWMTAKPTVAQEKNLAIATRFAKDVIEYGHVEYIDELLSPTFIEHNPDVPADRAGLKEFIRNIPGHQPEEIKSSWKHAPVLDFSEGPYVVMMWERHDKDPSDASLEYTRNSFMIFRIEDGLIQDIWN